MRRALVDRSSGKRIVCAVGLACLIAAPVSAQRPAGPFAGLFGGDPTEQRSEGLTFRGSLLGSYDENRAEGLNPITLLDQQYQRSGASAGATANLVYERNDDRTQWSVAGGGLYREYWGVSRLPAASYNVTTEMGTKLSTRTSMNITGALVYAPYYRFAPFLGAGVDLNSLASGFGFAALSQRNLRADATGGVTTNLTKQSSLSVNGVWSDWRFLGGGTGGVSRWGGIVAFNQSLTKGLGLHLSYTRDVNQYAVAGRPQIVHQSIDAGLNYGNAIEIARRTNLTFSTSTSAVRTQFDTRYRLNGSVGLARGLGRTWSTSVHFDRATNFTADFLQPILSDSARANIGGQLAPRLQWTSGVGYSRGEIGFGGAHFKTYSGSSKLTYGVTRHIGLYGQYGYYWHKLPPGISLLPLPPTFSRNSATAGLTVWMPIIAQMRGST